MRRLHVASSNGCLIHVFENATNEGIDEPAHWHSLTRAHTLCINKVWKYMYVRPALSDTYVRHMFEESTVKARRSRLCHNAKYSFIRKLSRHVCKEATSKGSVEPFKRYHQSVKQFRYRSSGLTFILSTWSWVQTVCNDYQQISLAVKE